MPADPQTIDIAWWIFEIITWSILILGIMLGAELFVSNKQKKSPIKKIAIALIAIAWITIFFGSYIEPKFLEVKEQTITLEDNTTKSVKLAVITDIHVGPYKKAAWTKRLVETLNKQEVDAVVLVGDFISYSQKDAKYLSPLSEINHKTFAVLGNHDQEFGDSDQITKELNSYGITVLRNTSKPLEIDGEDIDIAGIDDIWFTANPKKALKDTNRDTLTIMLAHNPDYILDKTSEIPDIIISGHTHGGQIRLPKLGPVPPLPTELGKKYDKGIFKLESNQLFISSGVGETGPRARLFDKPTIDILNIYYK